MEGAGGGGGGKGRGLRMQPRKLHSSIWRALIKPNLQFSFLYVFFVPYIDRVCFVYKGVIPRKKTIDVGVNKILAKMLYQGSHFMSPNVT